MEVVDESGSFCETEFSVASALELRDSSTSSLLADACLAATWFLAFFLREEFTHHGLLFGGIDFAQLLRCGQNAFGYVLRHLREEFACRGAIERGDEDGGFSKCGAHGALSRLSNPIFEHGSRRIGVFLHERLQFFA